MEIKRSGSQPSGKGPAEWFTGTVRIDPLHNPPDPARVAMALVTFEPGAAHGLAYASTRSDPHCDCRLRTSAARGRADRGNPCRRRSVVPAG